MTMFIKFYFTNCKFLLNFTKFQHIWLTLKLLSLNGNVIEFEKNDVAYMYCWYIEDRAAWHIQRNFFKQSSDTKTKQRAASS